MKNVKWIFGLMLIGFSVMSSVIYYTHETFGHGHEEEVVADHPHEEGVREDDFH